QASSYRRGGLIVGAPHSSLLTALHTLLAGAGAVGFEGVFEQHGDGHGADAARHGGDPACALAGRLEVHVAAQFAVVGTVHADVDDGGARLDPVSRDNAVLAHGHNHDIGHGDIVAQIRGEFVTDCDGGAGE